MTDPNQTKISDSKSWICSLKHFTRQNSGLDITLKNEQNPLKETQYTCASTFDKWLALRTIDVEKPAWSKILDMKMAMPVVNSFIEFNEDFKPISLLFAYFEGTIQCSPWAQIDKNFAAQIQAGRKRQLKKSLNQILQQIQRPNFSNVIIDESDNIQQTFMLETICFLYKKGIFIYTINFKGQLKIFKLSQSSKSIKLVQTFQFENRVVQAQCLPRLNQQKNENIIVAICFQQISIPFIIQISPMASKAEIQFKIEALYANFSYQQSLHNQNIKILCYDPLSKSVIACSQKNEITIYFLQQMILENKQRILVSRLEKAFFMEFKDKIQTVNDLSVKQNRLLILCAQSFYLYDIVQGTILKEGEKLRDHLDIGKLVSPSLASGKPLLLIKKKFNCLDPKAKTSTTLHLFCGK